MYQRLNNLGFVIGLFFTLIALILLIGSLLSKELNNSLDHYTGCMFLVFGLCMVFFNTK